MNRDILGERMTDYAKGVEEGRRQERAMCETESEVFEHNSGVVIRSLTNANRRLQTELRRSRRVEWAKFITVIFVAGYCGMFVAACTLYAIARAFGV